MVSIARQGEYAVGVQFEYEGKTVYIPLKDVKVFMEELAGCWSIIHSEYTELLQSQPKERKQRVNRKEG